MKQTQTETINDTLADQLAGYYKLFEMSKAQRLIHYLWKYKILFLFLGSNTNILSSFL